MDRATVLSQSSRERLAKAERLRSASALSQALDHPAREALAFASRVASRLYPATWPVKATTFWGDAMHVVLPEPVSLNLFRFGFFERGLTEFVVACVEPRDTFLDIGAHFGYYSLLASALVGAGGHVYAFEPTPRTFAVLQKNASSRSNIAAVPLAVHSRAGNMVLRDLGVKYSAYNSMFAPRLAGSRVHETRHHVDVISVDAFVAQHAITPNFVKIDAESAEYAILEGMAETIARCRPIITLEVGDHDLPGVPTSRELVESMRARGYAILAYDGGRIVRHEPRARYEYDNLLFVPEGPKAEELTRTV